MGNERTSGWSIILHMLQFQMPKYVNHKHNSLHQMVVCTRHAMMKWALVCTRACVLPHSLCVTPFLSATTTFDHGPKRFQTTETSGERCLLVKCGHRGHEPREGDLERNTSQGRIWLRQRSSNNDNRTSSLPRWYIPGSRGIRTRWPTNPTMSSSG